MTGLEIIRQKIAKVENDIQGYELSQTNKVIQIGFATSELVTLRKVEKELKAFEVLKDLLLLEVREIGGKYYIKYKNIEEDNYIDYEISEELYNKLKP